MDVPWHALRRDIVLPALERILSGAPAERVLDKALRGLDRDERHAAKEAVFGVALWRRRLAWQAGTTAPEALLEALLRPSADEPARLADRWSLPDWLEELLQRELGDDAEAFCRAVNAPGPICLRANRLRCTRDELAARLPFRTRPGALAKDALVVEERAPNLFGTDAWRQGLFEPQDEGSQLVGLAAGARPGDAVLDFCAGAGGKTLLLAGEMQNRGALHAWDVDPSRLDRLRVRAGRAGVDVRIGPPAPADLVLVDAPCSELGTLRRGPDLRWRLRPDPGLPDRQLAILEEAARFARRRLVYATCTIARAENEGVAERFEAAHPRWTRVRTLRLLPHVDGTDGFFAAVWET